MGMDWMPNEPASSCWASVSILPKTRSGWSSDACSKIGPNVRHGPHHDAQKSTRTVSFVDTTSAKFSLVSSTVAIACSLPSSPGSVNAMPVGPSAPWSGAWWPSVRPAAAQVPAVVLEDESVAVGIGERHEPTPRGRLDLVGQVDAEIPQPGDVAHRGRRSRGRCPAAWPAGMVSNQVTRVIEVSGAGGRTWTQRMPGPMGMSFTSSNPRTST